MAEPNNCTYREQRPLSVPLFLKRNFNGTIHGTRVSNRRAASRPRVSKIVGIIETSPFCRTYEWYTVELRLCKLVGRQAIYVIGTNVMRFFNLLINLLSLAIYYYSKSLLGSYSGKYIQLAEIHLIAYQPKWDWPTEISCKQNKSSCKRSSSVIGTQRMIVRMIAKYEMSSSEIKFPSIFSVYCNACEKFDIFHFKTEFDREWSSLRNVRRQITIKLLVIKTVLRKYALSMRFEIFNSIFFIVS